jgi:hypothetical protein
MLGDVADMARRLLAMLPAGWFGDNTLVLAALLQGLGTAFSNFWTLLQAVISQTRIRTATGQFLDLISTDFFGSTLLRFSDEADPAFQIRILQALLRPRATRSALSTALRQLTGYAPIIFEPARTTDTGGYTIGGVGYGLGGGWGSLALPYQFFITVFRPSGAGIAEVAGYGTGGIPVYASLSMEPTGITDSAIQAAVPPMLPAGTIAWMRLSDRSAS